MTPDRECYQEYIPGRQIQDAFDPERIPLLQMQHLRQLDFPITRRISYERTVDEFLLQLAVNDALRGLRSHRDMVILLNEEGALIRENGQFSLLFPPNPGELLTLAEDAPLYPVYMRILEKEKEGKVCRIAVPERSLPALLENISPFVILDEYRPTYMLVKLCLLPGLHEIAACILKHLGLDDENALDFGLNIFHNLEILCKGSAKI